jgi:hypothetical protein
MSIETRLKRLEAAIPEPLRAVTIQWPDEFDGPPLSPGWHPELSLFQVVWPDSPYEKVSPRDTPDAA